jgi:diguanylate cyclase (GGDEF)-like protein
MPTVTYSFAIDLSTLCAVSVFISATGGLLLLFSWAQNRSSRELAMWGAGYLLTSVGVALVTLRGLIPDTLSIILANTLLAAGYGVIWGGARLFEGRRLHISLILGGAALWVAACQIGSFYASTPARVMLASGTLTTYTLLIARELWYARDKELISRWPALVLVAMHAVFLASRIVLVGALPFPLGGGHLQPIGVAVMVFEGLFTGFCLCFLRVNMAKERAELQQRRAALVDLLTGVANRRAFFELGTPLLARGMAGKRPAALLLFDLDRFKQVNDSDGHQAGDRLLRMFGDLATARLRPGDVFARLGGEEFSCLLPDVSMAQALQFAERLRRDFEAIGFPCPPGVATVSVGVAMASDDSTLNSLLAAADRALYRAKAKGRNCVEAARSPLALVDALEAAMA